MTVREEIVQKSREFGRTMRELEDFGYFEQRLIERKAWRDFSNHTIDKRYRLAAVDAYYDEFCREPTDEEYEEVECQLRKKYEPSSLEKLKTPVSRLSGSEPSNGREI